jgi:hypothetical protein
MGQDFGKEVFAKGVGTLLAEGEGGNPGYISNKRIG